MKRWRQLLPLGMASLMLAAAPFTVFAASPEFARTEEEWARLRDNKIEYGELEDLIQEYNITVQTNQLDLNEFKRKYGTTKDDVSRKYRDLAEEIYSNLEYPDTDDPMYGYMVPSVLSAELQAKNMEKQADDNLEDSEIIYLNYKQAEKTLVTVAQSNLITYWQRQIQLEQAKTQKEIAQRSLDTVNAQYGAGTATKMQQLNAQEAVMNAERAIESSQTSLDNVRQKLQVMLGWKYDDMPEIEAVPEIDLTRIDRMNPQSDKEAALANNYTLQVNKKKLTNAGSGTTKESLQKTVADNERQIGSALMTNYQNVLAARLTLQQTEADLALEQQNAQTLQRQYEQGNVSKNQYETGQYSLQTKQLAVNDAKLALLQAIETYDWAVKGLASTS